MSRRKWEFHKTTWLFSDKYKDQLKMDYKRQMRTEKLIAQIEEWMKNGKGMPKPESNQMEHFVPGEELPYIEATRKNHGR